MSFDDAKNWMLVLTTLVTAIVAVITALRVKTVHTLVNSAMTQQKAENSVLQAMLVAKQLEIDAMEKVRLALAASTLHLPLPVVIVPPAAKGEPG